MTLPAYDDLRPIPATNFGGPRPRGILGGVEHTMVGTIASADARFKNPSSIVSATIGIGLSGRLVLWVALNRIAYHAGNWTINEERVGFENEDGGAYWDAVRTPELYLASGAVLAAVAADAPFNVDSDHVGRHGLFTATACPDALDVPRIIAIAQGEVMYVTIEEFTKYQQDVNASFKAVKDVLNPLVVWAASAPGLPKNLKKALEFTVPMPKISRTTKRRRTAKPAHAPTRAEVLAGHGKGR